MTAELTEEDRGKTLVAGTERIGTVTDVRGGTAYVDPDLDHVPDQLREALGWTEEGDEYTVDDDDVTHVANSQVRLRDDRFRDA